MNLCSRLAFGNTIELKKPHELKFQVKNILYQRMSYKNISTSFVEHGTEGASIEQDAMFVIDSSCLNSLGTLLVRGPSVFGHVSCLSRW